MKSMCAVRGWTIGPKWICMSGTAWQFWYLSTKAPRSHWDAVFHAGDYLVFGPESRGLPESMLREHADTALTIPMPGEGARSLNLSTAVAVVLYEGLRQTGI